MSTPKRHWCVLKDDTIMWFRQKQQSLKSGWMTKKGGGTGTFARLVAAAKSVFDARSIL